MNCSKHDFYGISSLKFLNLFKYIFYECNKTCNKRTFALDLFRKHICYFVDGKYEIKMSLTKEYVLND